MELSASQLDLLDEDLQPFLVLAGDRNTHTQLKATVAGIAGSAHLLCSQIAAFSPTVGRHPGQ